MQHLKMDSPYRDEIDNYHLDREKILLDEAGYSEVDFIEGLSEEEEVLPLDTEQFYVSESEGEGSEVSELGTRAWGSSKKAFYSQQEVGVSSSDEADELEEREAIELQNRLAATLSEGDFLSVQALEDGGEEVVANLSQVPEEDRLSLLERTSPELKPLMETLSSSAGLVSSLLSRLKGQDGATREITELKVHLNFCYCINAMFYLLLRASNERTQSHPVFSRLLSIKQLLSQVECIEPSSYASVKPKQSAIESDSTEHAQLPEDPLKYYERIRNSKRKEKKSVVLNLPEPDLEIEGDKRPITYQISRNKGLTPKRSKEQRNPRVKHRKKFKKAVQKRKGQVLPVQTEMNRYAGESSGIRSNVSRSVKIK